MVSPFLRTIWSEPSPSSEWLRREVRFATCHRMGKLQSTQTREFSGWCERSAGSQNGLRMMRTLTGIFFVSDTMYMVLRSMCCKCPLLRPLKPATLRAPIPSDGSWKLTTIDRWPLYPGLEHFLFVWPIRLCMIYIYRCYESWSSQNVVLHLMHKHGRN